MCSVRAALFVVMATVTKGGRVLRAVNSHGPTVTQKTRDHAGYKCTLHKISQLDSTKSARLVKSQLCQNKSPVSNTSAKQKNLSADADI